MFNAFQKNKVEIRQHKASEIPDYRILPFLLSGGHTLPTCLVPPDAQGMESSPNPSLGV